MATRSIPLDTHRTQTDQNLVGYGLVALVVGSMAVVVLMVGGDLVSGLYDRIGDAVFQLSRR